MTKATTIREARTFDHVNAELVHRPRRFWLLYNETRTNHDVVFSFVSIAKKVFGGSSLMRGRSVTPQKAADNPSSHWKPSSGYTDTTGTSNAASAGFSAEEPRWVARTAHKSKPKRFEDTRNEEQALTGK